MKKKSKFLIIISILSLFILPGISLAQTIAEAPIITAEVSNITKTSAEISVTVKKFDASLFPMKLSLVWGKKIEKINPQYINLNTENIQPSEIPVTLKTVVLENLDPSTEIADSTYSYRIIKTGTNIGYTEILNFTTSIDETIFTDPVFTLEIKPATNVKSNSATLYALIKTQDDISDFNKSFQYINDKDYKISGFTDESKIKSIPVAISTGTTEKTVSSSISDLESNTTYHFRLKMDGYEDKITYSNEASFTTQAPAIVIPSVVVIPDSNTNNTIPTTNTNSTSGTIGSTELIPCGTTNSAPCEGNEGWNNLMKLINNIVNFILFRLALPLAAIMFAYAGFELLTSGGNTEQMKKAKKIFINVAIGLILAAAAWLIVNTILSTLGYNGSWIGFS